MNSIQQIDWRLLRQQKEWLMNHNSPEANGLLHLLDAIQDEAVDQFGFTEREVFGRVEEEN
jgi:hypothetical protein